MNYERIYYQIIDRAKTRKLQEYSEKHHILPKCMGGSDEITNIVSLTAREHFICHWLLHEMYNDEKLTLAFSMMCNVSNDRQSRYIPSSRIVEYSRIEMSKIKKKFRHTEDAKQKIGESSRNRKYEHRTEEQKMAQSNKMKGRKISEDARLKMIGRVPWNKGMPMSDETKQKLKGRIRTDETKLKISKSRKIKK